MATFCFAYYFNPQRRMQVANIVGGYSACGGLRHQRKRDERDIVSHGDALQEDKTKSRLLQRNGTLKTQASTCLACSN